jgi:predicted metal-dependent phosphoesterase TrpH
MEGAEATRRIRVDMHLHTAASFDCLSAPEAVVARAAARGIDRICVTDHNAVGAALALQRRFPERVIAGEEVKTAEGVDVIGLFLDSVIPAGTPAVEACRRIHHQGGLVYVPHPFAGGKGAGGELLRSLEEHIDIVEAFNARVHDAELNTRAGDWAAARGLPVGAGSDAHTLAEIGRGWVELPDFEPAPAAFAAALRQGRIGGVISPRRVHVASSLARLWKHVMPAGAREWQA